MGHHMNLRGVAPFVFGMFCYVVKWGSSLISVDPSVDAQIRCLLITPLKQK